MLPNNSIKDIYQEHIEEKGKYSFNFDFDKIEKSFQDDFPNISVNKEIFFEIFIYGRKVEDLLEKKEKASEIFSM